MNKVISEHTTIGVENQKLAIWEWNNLFSDELANEGKVYNVSCHSILFITSGSAKYKLDFEILDLKEGDVLFLNPGQVFQCLELNDASGTILSFGDDFFLVYYDKDFFKVNVNLLNHLSQQLIVSIWNTHRVNLYSLLALIKLEMTELHICKPTIIQQRLIEALLNMLHRECEKQAVKDVIVAERCLAIRFKLLVQKNISMQYNVDYFTKELKVSKSTLQKATKIAFEKTPKDILEETLLLEAKRLLLISSMRIQEIAYELGFTDPTNFTKFFKRHEEMTPDRFRKQELLSYYQK